VSIEHYISVPRLSGITNAVTPFNKKQWDDMEYLMLGFLNSIPLPLKGHQGVKGKKVDIIECHFTGIRAYCFVGHPS